MQIFLQVRNELLIFSLVQNWRQKRDILWVLPYKSHDSINVKVGTKRWIQRLVSYSKTCSSLGRWIVIFGMKDFRHLFGSTECSDGLSSNVYANWEIAHAVLDSRPHQKLFAISFGWRLTVFSTSLGRVRPSKNGDESENFKIWLFWDDWVLKIVNGLVVSSALCTNQAYHLGLAL